jgi:hypothetical protein
VSFIYFFVAGALSPTIIGVMVMDFAAFMIHRNPPRQAVVFFHDELAHVEGMAHSIIVAMSINNEAHLLVTEQDLICFH